MNFDFFKDIGQQLAKVWREIKTYQKFTVVMAALLLMGMLTFLVVNATRVNYVSLFPPERLTLSDAGEVKAFLDTQRVDYKIKGETLIMVSSEQVSKVRMDLAAIGLPKLHSGKGFELFDTNTWIKGEKELQVLEMRALKGQLEQDIGQYENVRSASVILDIAPPRPFGGALYKTKASVILNLMEGARLSNSQLRAITFHIAGAVRGLEANMIAISDTTGKLYQSIDPEGSFDMLRSAEIAVEERLKTKIDGMLSMIVGADNFYSTVQVSMSRKKVAQERTIYSGQVEGQALGEAVVMSVTESGSQTVEKERAESGTPGTNNEAVAGSVAGGGEVVNRDESRNQQYKQMAVPVDHMKVSTVPGQIDGISVGVMIDKTITVEAGSDIPATELVGGLRQADKLKGEIESQLAKILEGYNVSTKPAVDFVEFDRARFSKKVQEEQWGSIIDSAKNVGTVLFLVLVVVGMFWTFNRFWKRNMMQPPNLEQEEDEQSFELAAEPSLVEVEAMVESIKTRFQNDPSVVIETFRDWIAETAGAEAAISKSER